MDHLAASESVKITVDDLIRSAGSPDSIADASVNFRKISAWAVQKWRRAGIPEDHWPLMMSLTGASVEQLYNANSRLLGRPLVVANQVVVSRPELMAS